ncbi:unnamed protein product [Alopecurus aequalis]
MRRPRRLAKAGGGGGGGRGEAPHEAVVAVGVKDAEGVSVITIDGEGEAPVLGFPVVAAAGDGGRERASLQDVGTEKGPSGGCGRGGRSQRGSGDRRRRGGRGVGVQGGQVVPTVDRKVDVPVVAGVQAIAVKGNGNAEKDEEGIKWLKHYSSAQSILVVGDGDLSFSLSLATAFGSGENLVATSLDSYGALTKKYGKAEMNITELKRLGATVLHDVDAKTMKLHSCLKMRRFDRIVYNFPHAGFKGKEDHLHVINAHKQLLHGFFANARHLLRPYGETHVSHKTGLPYDTWDIEQLANDSSLIMVRKVHFSKEDYPGYDQKRGDGAKCDQPFALGPCCTFMFCLGDVKKLKKSHGNRVASVLCLGDSKFYSGMRPFDLHPLAPAWPQPHFPPAWPQQHFPPAWPQPYFPFGVAPMQHPGFPVNYYGTHEAPYFHQQGMVRPMCWGPPLNVLPSQGGFHPQEGPPIEPPWIGGCSYSPQGYHSLQFEIHRQQTFCMESVQRQARLEMLIQFYGRQ